MPNPSNLNTMPAVGPPGRCWSGPARGLLIALALPIASCLALTAPIPTPPATRWPDLVVDPNTAPAPVLEALPGIGPALSGRIVAARAGQPFRSLADVDRRVKGIGPAKVAGLRPFLRFADSTPGPR